ncbi:SphA family protein [Dyella japonica]|uniref:Phenol degradation protein meta n=1 Tax=Dyella japonica DSM 16301 TaxID=1440762 RepID=A0A0G9H6T8_9GAMM|nr:transporter [Dyella japonica]KLD64964.1 hypothetical protein Y882_06015 [Dyella japonica DSM 16301]
MRVTTRAFAVLAIAIGGVTGASVHATEGAGGLYLLGSQALGAGLAPAPGWYVSTAVAQYNGAVGSTTVGGVTLVTLKKRVDSMAVNLLYAPATPIFGGQAAISVTAPYAYLRLSGEITGTRQTSGSVSNTDLADMAINGRLGWKINNGFSHAISLTVWAPTGDYNKGFNASLGHNRWAGDVLWAMTYVSPHSHLELSAAVGYGINGPNDITHYRSGNEAHVELAVGKRLSPHWVVGLAGYAYRQVTADTGRGANLGGLEGRVLGAGPAVNYGTRFGSHALAVGVRYYREFDANDHFHGDVVIASATFRL